MKDFQEKHWEEFEYGDENKMICYDSYHRYVRYIFFLFIFFFQKYIFVLEIERIPFK